jgi:hypothetical protein
VHPFKAEERGKRGLVLVVGIDGLVPTAAPNPNQNGKSFATYVYIHAGYKTATYAEGCLTIAPGDWAGFISRFPDGTRGIVRVLP